MKLRSIFAAVLALVFCLSSLTVYADTSGSGDGTKVTNMTAGKLMFITLQENTGLRWNVNGNAEKSNVLHLDTAAGSNCNFRFDNIGGGWYGIKHIRSGGTDYFADIEDKSKSEGKVLHLWESNDSKVAGNDHRQFAFYYIGDDAHGNKQYYIQNKNSGLWVGVEDTDKNGKPSVHDKIIQTSKSKRKVWIITSSVVPLTGAESENMTKSSQNDICEIFKFGTIKAVNRVLDSSIPGTHIHLHQVGTSNKWALQWNEEYRAYKILAMTEGEKYVQLAWDIEGESGKDKAMLNVWTDDDFDKNYNTSQLWRFFRQSDGSYKIQNARTGKFVGLYAGAESLWQDSNGTKFEIDVFANKNDRISYAYSQDWMADLPDNALLSSVNLPGSHDTGTASVVEDFVAQFSITSCQKYYYEEQLNIGVRSFDIRCNAQKDKAAPEDVRIVHGDKKWACSDRNGNPLTLKNILDESVRFLNEHPTESIVMMVKPDDGSTEGLARAVGSFIKKEVAKGNSCRVWTGNDIPSIKEARGKIVFIRRYDIDTNKYNPADDNLDERWFGINLSNWDDYSYGNYKYAIKIYGKDKFGTSVYAQDAYNEYSKTKLKYIEGTFAQTTGADKSHPIPSDAWIFNYTSCAVGRPLELTSIINPMLFEDKFGSDGKGYIDNRRLGMVMLNFLDRPMSRLIYETNFKNSNFMVAKADAPTTVSLVRGQKLSQAKLAGHSREGKWVFADGNYVPTVKDFKNGKTFKLRFIPSDSRLQGFEREVTITDFKYAGKTDNNIKDGSSKTNTDKTKADKTAKADAPKTSDDIHRTVAILSLLVVIFALGLGVSALTFRRKY